MVLTYRERHTHKHSQTYNEISVTKKEIDRRESYAVQVDHSEMNQKKKKFFFLILAIEKSTRLSFFFLFPSFIDSELENRRGRDLLRDSQGLSGTLKQERRQSFS